MFSDKVQGRRERGSHFFTHNPKRKITHSAENGNSSVQPSSYTEFQSEKTLASAGIGLHKLALNLPIATSHEGLCNCANYC